MNFSGIMVEAVLSTEKSCLFAHAIHFVAALNTLLKSEKTNHQMQHALFYAKHADKFTSPKHNLLVFQARTNTARIEAYKEVGATKLLLKTYLFYCSY